MTKNAWSIGLVLGLLAAAFPAFAADEPRVEALALCRDSWLDWQATDPAKLNSAKAFFESAFSGAGTDAFVTPKSPMTIAGLQVTQVYPESVGMGVGFSVLVDAPFDVARMAVEQSLGRPLGPCETGEGMRTCELPIAAQRTLMLASNEPPDDTATLVGCYYLYEK